MIGTWTLRHNFKSMLVRASALGLTLALAGCAKKPASSGPMTPPDAEHAGAAGGDDIDALEAELATREDQLRALGADGAGTRLTRDVDDIAGADAASEAGEAQSAPLTSSADPRPEKPVLSDRCNNICELSTSICRLHDHICSLAPRHHDEPRYQRACDRAAVDCDFATEACHACP